MTSQPGLPYPSRHSDIDCPTCGRWFHTTGDLTAHAARTHPDHPDYREDSRP